MVTCIVLINCLQTIDINEGSLVLVIIPLCFFCRGGHIIDVRHVQGLSVLPGFLQFTSIRIQLRCIIGRAEHGGLVSVIYWKARKFF